MEAGVSTKTENGKLDVSNMKVMMEKMKGVKKESTS